MNLREILFERAPAISAFYEIGFIPEEDEICELSQELYEAYERKGGDISRKLYTIVPHADRVQENPKLVGLLYEEDIAKLMKAAEFLRSYARKFGCKTDYSDDVLATAAKILPAVFSEKSRYAQPSKEESV